MAIVAYVNSNHTVFTANSTNFTSIQQLQWTFLPIVMLFVCVSGLLTNGLLVLLFFKHEALRTPFNVYVINLLLANVLSLLVQYPLSIVTNLYAQKWFMGSAACTVFLYCQGYLRAGITICHALIALNRTWAILRPLSYRAHHTVRFSIQVCVGMWCVMFLIEIPPPSVDAALYRLPLEIAGCGLTRTVKSIALWSIVNTCVFYVLPLAMVLLAFPLIYFNNALSRRKRVSMGNVSLTSTGGGATLQHNAIGVLAVSTDAKGTRLLKPDHENTAPPKDLAAGLMSRKLYSKYLLLALLTVSVTICFMPSNIYYVVISLNPAISVPWFYQTVSTLALFQSLLDPILFTMAVGSLRKAVLQLVEFETSLPPPPPIVVSGVA